MRDAEFNPDGTRVVSAGEDRDASNLAPLSEYADVGS
jgi:hypothetical protein